MFDYQAGEKYRLTLIMVGIAGLIAGAFFTLLLMPTPEPTRHRAMPSYARDPDITGVPGGASSGVSSGMLAAGGARMVPSSRQIVDPIEAKSLMESWLPLVWDLSAATAKESQEKAIGYMTPECAANYRKNQWSDEIAKKISESTVESDFHINSLKVGDIQADGSVVVYVNGKQTLSAAGVSRSRNLKLQYVIVQTADGQKISEIIESKS